MLENKGEPRRDTTFQGWGKFSGERTMRSPRNGNGRCVLKRGKMEKKPFHPKKNDAAHRKGTNSNP